MNNREPIGLKSLSGVDILEGSTVAVYDQKFETIENHHVDDGSEEGANIRVLDGSKPLPVADVVLAHGHVYWDEWELAWRARMVWRCTQWEESGIASVMMGGRQYAFEIIDQ